MFEVILEFEIDIRFLAVLLLKECIILDFQNQLKPQSFNGVEVDFDFKIDFIIL